MTSKVISKCAVLCQEKAGIIVTNFFWLMSVVVLCQTIIATQLYGCVDSKTFEKGINSIIITESTSYGS